MSAFSHFFIDRPIFATVVSVVITLTGAIALYRAADRAVSPDHAAGDPGDDQLSRRQRPGRGRHGGRARRTTSQRRRGHALHVVADGQRRLVLVDGHLRRRHRPEHGPGDGAKPGDAGHADLADAGAKSGHHDPQADARHLDDRQLLFQDRPLRRPLSEQFRHDQRARRTAADRRRIGREHLRSARLQHSRLARSSKDGGLRHQRQRRGGRRSPARTSICRPGESASRRPPAASRSTCPSTRWAGCWTPSNSARSSSRSIKGFRPRLPQHDLAPAAQIGSGLPSPGLVNSLPSGSSTRWREVFRRLDVRGGAEPRRIRSAAATSGERPAIRPWACLPPAARRVPAAARAPAAARPEGPPAASVRTAGGSTANPRQSPLRPSPPARREK